MSILKHIDQNLSTCYDALLQEMSKKRAKCPRLYLLSDEDMLEILCCNGNLESFSNKISKVFNEIDSLRIETSLSNEKKIIGCFGRNKEYFSLKMVKKIIGKNFFQHINLILYFFVAIDIQINH